MNAPATIGNLRCWVCAVIGTVAVMAASQAFAGKPYGVLASYKPDNVHRGTPGLAPYLRRVAVLPLPGTKPSNDQWRPSVLRSTS